jgi:hypothetical protein
VKNILYISKCLGKKYLDEKYNCIIELLRLCSNTQSIEKNNNNNSSSDNVNIDLEKDINNIIQTSIESKIYGPNDLPKISIISSTNDIVIKPVSRSNFSSFTPIKISISRYVSVALISHYNPADLSMLSDFNELNKYIDIVKKGFVTLRGPILYKGTKLILRDTFLLSPAGLKSLSAIGAVYNLNKIELSKHEIRNMDLLFDNNPNKFIEYAMRDSLIALCHISWIEMFYFSKGGLGLPLTLSGVGKQAINQQWEKEGYKGYHITHEPMVGDTIKLQTPIGLNSPGYEKIGTNLSLYLKSYR